MLTCQVGRDSCACGHEYSAVILLARAIVHEIVRTLARKVGSGTWGHFQLPPSTAQHSSPSTPLPSGSVRTLSQPKPGAVPSGSLLHVGLLASFHRSLFHRRTHLRRLQRAYSTNLHGSPTAAALCCSRPPSQPLLGVQPARNQQLISTLPSLLRPTFHLRTHLRRLPLALSTIYRNSPAAASLCCYR